VRRCLVLLRHDDGDTPTLARLSPLGAPALTGDWRFAT